MLIVVVLAAGHGKAGGGLTRATGCRTRSLAEGRSFLLTPGADWVTPECAGGGRGIGYEWIGWGVLEEARVVLFMLFVVDRELDLGARAISGSGRART